MSELRTLAGFRSDHKEAVDDLFVQVVGMLSAEGLITMERFTLDGTKIKANASGNTFRRKEKIEAHLALAREQVLKMNEQAAQEENGVRTRVYRASKATCRRCSLRDQCGPKKQKPGWARSISRNEDPPASAAFKVKMETEAAKQIYRQRSQIAEFPHAWLKERCGLRQFRCRGRTKTSIEATWACLSYNLIRWFSIRRKFQAQVAAWA